MIKLKEAILRRVASVAVMLTVQCIGLGGTLKQADTQQSPLRVVTSITSERYCRGTDGSFYTLQMELGLSYTNVGQQPLIVYRSSGDINRQMISTGDDNASAKQYIVDMSLTIFTDRTAANVEDFSLGTDFIVLAPNASVTTKASTDAVVFLSSGKHEVSENAMSPGKYVLQIEVSPWHWSRDIADRLSRRWQERGILWLRSAVSKPMPFVIEKRPKFVDCSPKARYRGQ
ncbi:MAG: hypothetical protein QOG23_5728 [Blastocatellia bacterium]|jgi:hypothetical protein|nr:hypothetical protein [Blastocatellia bacterium]